MAPQGRKRPAQPPNKTTAKKSRAENGPINRPITRSLSLNAAAGSTSTPASQCQSPMEEIRPFIQATNPIVITIRPNSDDDVVAVTMTSRTDAEVPTVVESGNISRQQERIVPENDDTRGSQDFTDSDSEQENTLQDRSTTIRAAIQAVLEQGNRSMRLQPEQEQQSDASSPTSVMSQASVTSPPPETEPEEEEEDPWIAALDDIAPPSTRHGLLSITHNMPTYNAYEIDMMEDLKLPEDIAAIQYPKVGNVQILKMVDETTKTYDGLDLLDGRFVTVRQLERQKHMKRLRLACRLSIPLGDAEEYKRIYQLLFPPKTTFVLFREKLKETGEMKMNYYWMEPPNHGSLHAYVIERKRLPEAQCKDYFRQICQIVEFCHQRGVIIRDLKLRKFVFADARRQTVKLDDLDETAICPENKHDPDLIDYDQFDPDDDRLCDRHGCPAYVSPEILDLSKKWYSGKAADVWSLGVLLYVLLVGRYPFYDVTPAGLFTKIRQARIQLTDHDGVRLEARLLIRCMLRKDPRERPSVTEILANSWLRPKDYRSAFKVFDSSDCVFWKLPGQRPGSSSTDSLSTSIPSTSGVGLIRVGGATPQQPLMAPRVPQGDLSSGAQKILERLRANNLSASRR